MQVLRHVDVVSAAKVTAVLAAIWGFIFAVLSLAILAPIASMASAYGSMTGIEAAPLMMGFGRASIIIIPIIMAIVGFITGAIWAFLYNVVADRIGGVEIELK